MNNAAPGWRRSRAPSQAASAMAAGQISTAMIITAALIEGVALFAQEAYRHHKTIGAWGDGTKPTGKHFAFSGASVFAVKDGKIATQSDYYDALGFYKQLGLM